MYQHTMKACRWRHTCYNFNHIGHSTVERVVHLYKTTGEVKSTQTKHGPERKLSEQEELIVLQLFLDSPGIYLREVRQELQDRTGNWVD